MFIFYCVNSPYKFSLIIAHDMSVYWTGDQFEIILFLSSYFIYFLIYYKSTSRLLVLMRFMLISDNLRPVFSTTSTVTYQPISRSGTLTFSYIADTYSESNQGNTDYLNITTCRGVMNNFSGIWTSKDTRITSVAFNCSSAENVHVSETHTVCQSLRKIY